MTYPGYRLFVAVGGGKARAYTRLRLDWPAKVMPLLEAVRKFKVRSAHIGDKTIALGGDGRSNVQALQNALEVTKAATPALCSSAPDRRRSPAGRANQELSGL